MKIAVFILTIALTGVLAGCSDTNPAEPVVAQSNTFTTVTPPLAKPGNSIPLTAVLREPTAPNRVVTVNGLVKYTVVVGDEIEYPDRYTVEVNFTTDATLTTAQDETKSLPPVFISRVLQWNVSAKSVDRLVVAKHGSALLTKSYPIAGRTDGTMLNVMFTVSHTTVTLKHMWFTVACASVDPPQS